MIQSRELAAEAYGDAAGRGSGAGDGGREFGLGVAQSHAVQIGGEANDALAVVAFDEAGHGSGFERRDIVQAQVGTAFLHHREGSQFIGALQAVLRKLDLDLKRVARSFIVIYPIDKIWRGGRA